MRIALPWTASHPSWAYDVNTIVSTHLRGAREEACVYNLFCDPKAVGDWRTACSSAWTYAGRSLKYGSVFCHAKPMVEFTSATPGCPGKKCELADLLVVFSDSFTCQRYASLYQVKMTKKWPPGNTCQFDLYTQWPSFSYVPDPAKATRATRILPFTSAVSCATYAFFDKSAKSVDVAEAVTPLSDWPLWVELSHTLIGALSRPFSWTRAAARDDWDELIWDLIDHTAGIAVSSGVVPGVGAGATRGFDVLNLLVSGSYEPPSISIDKPVDVEDRNWGIPIVHFAWGPTEGATNA